MTFDTACTRVINLLKSSRFKIFHEKASVTLLKFNHIIHPNIFHTLHVGGVEVHPMVVKVYQSALQDKISINGNGFKEGMSFNFEPDLKVRSNPLRLPVCLSVCLSESI